MELGDHLAEYELAIAQAKADRQILIDSDRPNWRNSLAALVDWKGRHGVTAEELTDEEEISIRLAHLLTEVGANRLLNAGRFILRKRDEAMFEMGEYDGKYFCANGEGCTVVFNANGIIDIRRRLLSLSCDSQCVYSAIPTETLKAFFSNE